MRALTGEGDGTEDAENGGSEDLKGGLKQRDVRGLYTKQRSVRAATRAFPQKATRFPDTATLKDKLHI